jgi:hypothetical protein
VTRFGKEILRVCVECSHNGRLPCTGTSRHCTKGCRRGCNGCRILVIHNRRFVWEYEQSVADELYSTALGDSLK